ncbi:hypothetical protein Psyaliredsea_07600 [Psychrobacter alimentarius]
MVSNPTELITSDKNTTVKLVKALLAQARQRKSMVRQSLKVFILLMQPFVVTIHLSKYYYLSQHMLILRYSKY